MKLCVGLLAKMIKEFGFYRFLGTTRCLERQRLVYHSSVDQPIKQ